MLRFGYRFGPTAAERVIDGPSILEEGVEKHLVLVWDGDGDAAALYLDGELLNEGQTYFELSDIIDNNNWLGRAQWNDPMYVGSYNEFRIYDYALTANQVPGNFEAGPDAVNLIPEPSTLTLLIMGLIVLAVRAARTGGRSASV